MLNRAQIQLRQDISRANKRISRLAAAGVKSPAVERLLTALGNPADNKIKLGRGASASREMAIRQAVNRFLKSETSTVGGYKKVQEKRRQGTFQAFKDRGFGGNAGDIDKTLKGAKSFAEIAEMFSMSSDDVQTEFIRGAGSSEKSEQVMKRLEQMSYEREAENMIDEIDDFDWTEFDI